MSLLCLKLSGLEKVSTVLIKPKLCIMAEDPAGFVPWACLLPHHTSAKLPLLCPKSPPHCSQVPGL